MLDHAGAGRVARDALSSRARQETRVGGIQMERMTASLAEGEAAELLTEAAEAHALARELARWGCRWAVADLESYAAALEAMAR